MDEDGKINRLPPQYEGDFDLGTGKGARLIILHFSEYRTYLPKIELTLKLINLNVFYLIYILTFDSCDVVNEFPTRNCQICNVCQIKLKK